nr:MAG TPA: hypothetical protein [Caudoviricetes sp.]
MAAFSISGSGNHHYFHLCIRAQKPDPPFITQRHPKNRR